jgi:hypothetical protein
MFKLMLAAVLCAAAGAAQAQSLPNSGSSASVMSGSIDQTGDITLRAPKSKLNLNLPEVVGADSKGVDASAITPYTVTSPSLTDRTKPNRWTFNGNGESADQRHQDRYNHNIESDVQDDYDGQLNVDGYDNINIDPDK